MAFRWRMAFRWLADDDPTLNAGMVALSCLGEPDHYCLETLYLVIFQGRGSGPPAPPPSVSAYDNEILLILLKKIGKYSVSKFYFPNRIKCMYIRIFRPKTVVTFMTKPLEWAFWRTTWLLYKVANYFKEVVSITKGKL